MYRFIVFLLVASSLPVSGQSENIKGNVYSLKGRLSKKFQVTPPCGHIAFATVMEFKVLSFSGADLNKDKTQVILTCPGFYPPGVFKKGLVYDLIVADQNQSAFEWLIINRKVLKKSTKPQFWVIEIRKSE
ncbi:MAG: hypothetical protein HEP71_34090 [Roseivirga sp.]|nr:hypothetical protein [Roseivirga sp.]